MRGFISALCLSLSCSLAWADGYRDFNAGLAAALQRQQDTAIASFTRALSQSDLPQHLMPVAYFDRADEYFEKEKYALAIADYTAALHAKPDYIDAYLERCRAYAVMNRLADAIADCSRAVELAPDNWRLRKMRLGVYVQAKQFDVALADLTAFMATRPDNPELLLARAETLRQAGQFDRAVADAQAAHREARDWVMPFAELGWIYLAQRDFRKARDSFDDAVDRSQDSLAYLLRGQSEWAMGDYDDAAKSFRESLDRSQLQSYAFLWLTIAEVKAGKKVPDDIAARFGGADLSRWPGPIVSLYLGKAAPADVLRLKGKDPDSDDDKECTANFFAAEWQEVSGNVAEAKRLLQQVSAVCPSDSLTALYASIDSARLAP